MRLVAAADTTTADYLPPSLLANLLNDTPCLLCKLVGPNTERGEEAVRFEKPNLDHKEGLNSFEF